MAYFFHYDFIIARMSSVTPNWLNNGKKWKTTPGIQGQENAGSMQKSVSTQKSAYSVPYFPRGTTPRIKINKIRALTGRPKFVKLNIFEEKIVIVLNYIIHVLIRNMYWSKAARFNVYQRFVLCCRLISQHDHTEEKKQFILLHEISFY